MRVLDSHLHLWDPARLDYDWLTGPLRARFDADELAAAVGGLSDARGFVFVQAGSAEDQYLDEVEWVTSLASRVNVRGIVAGARLDCGAATLEYLDAVAAKPLVVGVRHLLQGEPAGFAGTTEFRAGAVALVERDLTFDACVRGTAQLRDVAALAAELPELRVVLDHLGKPSVGTAEAPVAPSTQWSDGMHALAANSQVFCKLSGLPAEAGGAWDAAQMVPFLDVALAAFGPDRLMIGSDWPVSAVRAAGDAATIDPAAIPAWTDAVASWAASRDLDTDAILWRGAERFYGIG
ncbi:amidohydrolase family protein [Microbacterium sp. A93]|uniref:amidohydrolase family protein n=1 Tax=Microbacterium sp. A93 TaxID=3450716 RepID=UPI003F41DB41